MSIKGFEVGGVQAKYDYESLDNIPANLVQDANYVHTDNNYTNADKTKLSGIEAQANKTTIDATLTHSGQAADAKATGDAISALNAQVIASMPHDTASGSIANFPDGAAMPVRDLSVDIEPVQAGSGDPSPDNVRPISGWTECKVTRTGKNLLNLEDVLTDAYVDGTTEKILTISGANVWYADVPKNTNIVYSADKGNRCVIAGYKTRPSTLLNSTADELIYNIGAQDLEQAFNTGENTFVAIYVNRDQTNKPTWIQLELGSTATAYEAYQGQTYTIDLDGTRYGGTLDVTSGKLTVDRAIVTISSSWNPALSSTGDTVAVAQYSQNHFPGIASAPLPVSNRFSTNIPSGQIGRMVYGAPNLYLAVPKSELASVNVDGLKSWFGSHETQVCYKLATPIEVDLTPTEITTLLGTNNIFADCGDTTVDYYADTTLFVNKKIAAAVAALS